MSMRRPDELQRTHRSGSRILSQIQGGGARWVGMSDDWGKEIWGLRESSLGEGRREKAANERGATASTTTGRCSSFSDGREICLKWRMSLFPPAPWLAENGSGKSNFLRETIQGLFEDWQLASRKPEARSPERIGLTQFGKHYGVW